MKKSLPLDAVPGAQLKTRENSEYLSNRIIVKLMPHTSINEITAALPELSIVSARQMFPAEMIDRNSTDVDLSRFYIVSYSSPHDAFSIAEELSAFPTIQYAEPSFIYPLTVDPSFTPNDPSYGSQYGLTKIQAPQAWDITQGDTSVVIGIVDSGVEVNHPDLVGNIWQNPGENGLDIGGNDKRANGTDDDGNGFVDDWRGWDFGGVDYNNVVSDNNPSPVGANTEHGTHVAGIASASTNNSIGVAGTGFKCKLLAIKTSADNDTRGPGGTAYIISGYEGIAYAAFMGADVMNCSWGGSGGSQAEQEIINYATQLGTLVVAAAGNGNTSALHYPSAYANVISVAATNSSDIRSSYSNYGTTIDVCAPGDGIMSTIFPGTYTNFYSGTSMASPFVAGTAGLVKAFNPGFTATQVGEKVRVTAENIDGINPSFAGQLGKGRINAFRALTVNLPAVRARAMVVRDSANGNNNGVPEPSEILDLYFTFQNYLSPTTNASATITTTASGLTITNGTVSLGALGTLDTLRNTSTPYRIQLSPTVTPGLAATVRLTVTDGSYSDVQFFTVVINPTYQSHNANGVKVTMTNNGRIGYNDFPNNTQGLGFRYALPDTNHLFEGGLIIGTSATKLVNNIRNAGGTQDNDFLSRQIYSLQSPGVISNQDGSTVFSDSSAPLANRIGIRVNQYSYVYSSPTDEDYIIVRYDIRNLTAAAITNLHIGQFFDWDVFNYGANRTGYDATRSLAYAWDNSNATRPYIGMRALDSAAGVRGLVNTTGIVLDRAAKWGWISGGTASASVGPADIHNAIGSGPFSIASATTRTVGFALLGGSNLADLQANADAARQKWNEILSTVSVGEDGQELPATFALQQNYPNPFNPSTMINYQLATNDVVSLKVYDILGREVATLIDGKQNAGNHRVEFNGGRLGSGVYFYRLIAGEFTAVKKMILTK
ncbi:MAG: S8 family serine peptidase [Bacteroidota bacterium]